MIEQGFIMRVDGTERVAKKVKLVLESESRPESCCIEGQGTGCSRTTGNEASVWPFRSGRVREAVTVLGALSPGRADEASHRGLRCDECSFIQGADYDGGQKTKDLV